MLLKFNNYLIIFVFEISKIIYYCLIKIIYEKSSLFIFHQKTSVSGDVGNKV